MNALIRPALVDPPRAILLDLDNTLYDYDRCHEAALTQVSTRFSRKYRVDENDFRAAWASSRAIVKQRLGPTASSHSRLLYLKQTLYGLGLGSEIQSAVELERIYWNAFLRDIAPAAGALAFLERVRVHGIPCLIVTDLTTEIQLRKVLALGIADLVDGVITSEEAGGDKVTGLPYRLAVEHLGIEGHEMWMVGDDPHADIEASVDYIGSAAIQRLLPSGLGRKQRPSPRAADVFTSFWSLMSKLDEVGLRTSGAPK